MDLRDERAGGLVAAFLVPTRLSRPWSGSPTVTLDEVKRLEGLLPDAPLDFRLEEQQPASIGFRWD